MVRADTPANAADNVVTITFNVTVDANAADGTIIANQAFVTGSDVIGEVPSDDPRTPVINDARLGPHTGYWQSARSKRTPLAASRSRMGD